MVTETELKTDGRAHRRESQVNRSDRQPPTSPSEDLAALKSIHLPPAHSGVRAMAAFTSAIQPCKGVVPEDKTPFGMRNL